MRGKRAVEWRLVDEVIPKSIWDRSVRERALELAARSDRPSNGTEGASLGRLSREFSASGVAYTQVRVQVDRDRRTAELHGQGPADASADGDAALRQGDLFWPLAMARELDDVILHLRFNEPELGLIVLRTDGRRAGRALMTRFSKLTALTGSSARWGTISSGCSSVSTSPLALHHRPHQPGSCFTGTLAELVFAADRSAILEGGFKGESRGTAGLTLATLYFGTYPMSNGLARIATRFLGEARKRGSRPGDRPACRSTRPRRSELGLVTVNLRCDCDWADEIRIMLEERAKASAPTR